MTEVVPVLSPISSSKQNLRFTVWERFQEAKFIPTKHLPQCAAIGTSGQAEEREKETGKGADSWIRLHCVY